MKRLQLDPYLLTQAESALDVPVLGDGTPLSGVVPVRECIHRSVEELLRRRPTQEGTGKGIESKVLSIGHQCGRPGLPPGHFEELGAQFRTLIDTISGTKQRKLAREVLVAIFNRSLLTFNAFLDSLDVAALRTP